MIDDIDFADDDGYAFASNYGSEDLINLINGVITSAKSDGSLDQLFVDALTESFSLMALVALDFKPVLEFLPNFGRGVLITLGFALFTIVVGTILGFLLFLLRNSLFESVIGCS